MAFIISLGPWAWIIAGAILLALELAVPGAFMMWLGLAAVMVGAVATMHAQHGFFMNWYGAAGGEGFEYHLLALGLSVPLLVLGGGHAALDTRLLRSRPSVAAAFADA